MPAQLSKFFVEAACKNYVHPWADNCISPTVGLGLHTMQESLRIYTTVYLLTLIMKGKIPSQDDFKRTILGILQSTAFLSWSAFTYSMFICSLRRLLGNFNILTVSFLPSFLSSLSAIIIERPSRRTMLCLYVSNIATETLFRMGVWRGYFRSIPHGEVYIFAASIAVLLYFYRSKKNKHDSVYKIIRFILGHHEEAECFRDRSVYSDSQMYSIASESRIRSESQFRSSSRQKSNNHVFGAVWKSFEVYKDLIKSLKNKSKHPSCPHNYSCAHYVITGGLKVFSCGICIQLVLKGILQGRKLLRKPKFLKNIVFKKENLNLATFLGGFAALYKLTSCLLRRTFNKDSQQFAIPAGLVASIAFMAYPNNTIALYFMWKALQLLWNNGVEKGKLPEVKWFVLFLYSFSTAVLFHAAIIEPQNLRSSYWKFLYTISGGRIAVMSRTPLEAFGLDSHKSLLEVLKKSNTTNQISYSF